MSKIRMFVVAALLALLVAAAVVCAKASWKWSPKHGNANVPYKIAGWSWGDGKADRDGRRSEAATPAVT
jgi:hypothetical protein